ncbi:MAG TPA: Tex family protein [Candidatus Sphingobacterium stercoripullorum]|nr:Tex family protein [Candidatus Sphingobacterium stercoripullorum]
MQHEQLIAKELTLPVKQVSSTIELLDSGSTVPFIARYRKEVTGGLTEVEITAIRDRSTQLRELDKRKETVLKTIKEQGKLTPALEKQIQECVSLTVLEDLYLPYRPKRRTRATIAKEKGLEPLASLILEQGQKDPRQLAEEYVNAEKEVGTVDDALDGARDVIAEWVSEHAELRSELRKLFLNHGVLASKVVAGKEEEGIKYRDYFEWSEPIKDVPSHRLLAMRRGEKEGILYLDIQVEEEAALDIIESHFLKAKNNCAEQVKLAATDGYKRLLKPSMETELRVHMRQNADEQAIDVFAKNARELLLAPPLGQKRILGIDPGLRTGCKVVVIDNQGNLLDNTTIFPFFEQGKIESAKSTISKWVEKYKVDAIAIGNGTAGRETEQFVKSLGLKDVQVVMVNESGASIYSASDVAREEFPDHDVTVRGAISIARRLMDPLAELVKIDPKSIGVGQYQHDVDQKKLQQSLDDTVVSCVNAVGVELNTASKQLLSYVSGLGPSLAQNIVKFREENGPFKSRKELKKVPRLGEKAFEQAAGFLRIIDAKNVLDRSAVHPERYSLVEKIAKDLGEGVESLLADAKLSERVNIHKYVDEEVGLPTLKDILEELEKPGRDPREEFEAFSFTDGVNTIADLKTGMKLPGIVTNVTNFGAFVDIGVHQDGLVHISQLSNQFVSDPNEVVKVQQKVLVEVVEVDEKRNRIGLSMKTTTEPQGRKKNPGASRSKKKKSSGDFASKLSALKAKFG